MTKKEIQEKRIEAIQEFISNRNKENCPPTINDIIQELDKEKLFEELNSEKSLTANELLEKKKNVFRNILKTQNHIKCNKTNTPTYYLTKEKRLSDKAKRLKSTLTNFTISEPLYLGSPVLPDFKNNRVSNGMRPCGIYFIHKYHKSKETIKYHVNTLIYRLEMNFKANAVFTELEYLDIKLIGEKGCLLILPTTDTAIESYDRINEIINNAEAAIEDDEN